ncbi:Tat pathway signal protein [Brevundimonas sp.]|uniref:Tat pathway signal protein n=1 Tax=Brevundimonas sp. TaxID=1871086 RepID=UPI002D405888|nr:Tat pathway signal protein [Brevundimonas sp.]HYC98594.1 Tat pathway signal protein [Brevundimonas sp.]
MARTPSDATPTHPDHQQMDRSNDPEITRAMDEAAPELAMVSRRQRLTGSAVGVGSVGFDEDGAFDVGDPDRDPRDDPAGG